ncbi:MAG: helix-turn-helix transcriptional regulator [Polyangiaceae bacterium]|nr:helix-turn-helix transcriptional regulator [Polyangiaceae bacterium]
MARRARSPRAALTLPTCLVAPRLQEDLGLLREPICSLSGRLLASPRSSLAALLGVHQGNIAFWEWAEKPPRGEVLPKMAKAFGVRVDDLLVDAEAPRPRRSGPVGRLQRVFEEAASLPRTKQDLVVQFVATLLDQHKKAS